MKRMFAGSAFRQGRKILGRAGLVSLVGVVFSAACREDPGGYDYSSHDGLGIPPADTFLAGPTPYVEDVQRLYLTPALYEPSGQERIFPLNGRNTFLFVFDTVGNGTGQFTLNPPGPEFTTDRVQGEESSRWVHAGLTFYGFGVFWNRPRDISQYSTFNLSLKSNATTKTTYDDFNLDFSSGAASPSRVTTAQVAATDYGYVNDGRWHNLTIPITDLIELGFDPTSVRVPLSLGGGPGDFGDAFLLDDVYYQ